MRAVASSCEVPQVPQAHQSVGCCLLQRHQKVSSVQWLQQDFKGSQAAPLSVGPEPDSSTACLTRSRGFTSSLCSPI
jgi:hypothetical protein